MFNVDKSKNKIQFGVVLLRSAILNHLRYNAKVHFCLPRRSLTRFLNSELHKPFDFKSINSYSNCALSTKLRNHLINIWVKRFYHECLKLSSPFWTNKIFQQTHSAFSRWLCMNLRWMSQLFKSRYSFKVWKYTNIRLSPSLANKWRFFIWICTSNCKIPVFPFPRRFRFSTFKLVMSTT
jgi:hypothetical protein